MYWQLAVLVKVGGGGGLSAAGTANLKEGGVVWYNHCTTYEDNFINNAQVGITVDRMMQQQ